ncbi:MAG: tautomerase family protein [Clostridia bacterium]|nr:tautomerase family protein [Clostridia bacterium]
MPYISIKSYPKDEETKKKIAEKINKIFLEEWGCPQEAISLSIEEFPPKEWEEKVLKSEVLTKKDKMMIIEGKKTY